MAYRQTFISQLNGRRGIPAEELEINRSKLNGELLQVFAMELEALPITSNKMKSVSMLLLVWLIPVTLFATGRPELTIVIRHVVRSEYEKQVNNYRIYANEYPKHSYIHLSENTVKILDQGELLNYRVRKFEATEMEYYHQTYWEYHLVNANGVRYFLRVILSHKGRHSRFNADLQTDLSNGIPPNDKGFGYYSSKHLVN